MGGKEGGRERERETHNGNEILERTHNKTNKMYLDKTST